jgi:hypothetical protein
MAQDYVFQTDPHPSHTRDVCKNVVGGDSWYKVKVCFEKPISWDVLNDLTVDASWDILNDILTDVSWDIINDVTEDFSWDILNELLQQTSWHIHPAIIEYIQQYLIKYIRSEFSIRKVQTGYQVKPITTNFNVADVITDSAKLKPLTWPTFNINKIQTSFSLRQPITRNFVITRVNDNTRSP